MKLNNYFLYLHKYWKGFQLKTMVLENDFRIAGTSLIK